LKTEILLKLNTKNMDNTTGRVVMVNGLVFVAGGQEAVRCWKLGGSQMVQLLFLGKVRRMSCAALRIRKDTESVFGTSCVLHERKQVERFIGLDVDITCCGGVLMAVRGVQ
jgi:hypothetical protein